MCGVSNGPNHTPVPPPQAGFITPRTLRKRHRVGREKCRGLCCGLGAAANGKVTAVSDDIQGLPQLYPLGEGDLLAGQLHGHCPPVEDLCV